MCQRHWLTISCSLSWTRWTLKLGYCAETNSTLWLALYLFQCVCVCVCYVPKQQTLNRQNKHFRRRRHSAASSQLTRISPIKPYSSEQENQQKLEQASKMKQKTDQQCRASSCVETWAHAFGACRWIRMISAIVTGILALLWMTENWNI